MTSEQSTRASNRDNVRRGPTTWAGGATHVGSKASPNQDALAIAATSTASHHSAIVAVSDGVSTSPHSDIASQLAVDAATDSLIAHLTSPDHSDEPADLATALRTAVLQANDAILSAAGPDTDGYACTLVLALIHRGLVMVANMGDSRAYWFGDDATNLLLTTDDSMAQLSIALGTSREIAESSRQAHAITKWLGPNAPDLDPQLGGFRVAGPGWILVCSDGLWNYASEPDSLRQVWDNLPASEDATAEILAGQLIDWANDKGGHDNITVGLVRVDEAGEPLRTGAQDAVTSDVPPSGETTASNDGADATTADAQATQHDWDASSAVPASPDQPSDPSDIFWPDDASTTWSDSPVDAATLIDQNPVDVNHSLEGEQDTLPLD